jgi:hypothetical protein
MLSVVSNQEAKQKVESLKIPDSPVHVWLASHESVKAIFYKGAVALLEKTIDGWMLSYMYTFPERRRQGDISHILKYLKQSYIVYAIPVNSIAEDVLKKAGFVTDARRFGIPFYRLN